VSKNVFAGVDITENQKNFIKNLFPKIKKYQQRRAERICRGGEVNGLTLQAADLELKSKCPDFYEMINYYLGSKVDSAKVSRRVFFNQIAKEKRLFYLGSLPIYAAYGWAVKDEDLTEKLRSRNIKRYLNNLRDGRAKLIYLLEKETDSHKKAYFEQQEIYFNNQDKYTPKEIKTIKAKLQGLLICMYETF